MKIILLAIAIGIFLIVDITCGALLTIICKKQKKKVYQFIFPGYSIYAYYKYKKEHIK
jgi:hypothetical protein